MQELAKHVYIETNYAGVTLCAINWSHGLILMDAPFRQEDTRSWRSALLNLSGGVDRLMINLDGHYDRTIGTRAMDCTMLGHEKLVAVLRGRPVTFKTTGNETGAEWEMYSGLGNIRWAPPEITFTQQMTIHWDDSPLHLEYHPGPAVGAIWGVLPAQHIVFVGDAVVAGQTPFLSSASLPEWLEALKLLRSAEYQDYLIISGRSGEVSQADVKRHIDFLEFVQGKLVDFDDRKADISALETIIPDLMGFFDVQPNRRVQYEQRLRYGLQRYFIRHFISPNEEIFE